MMNLTDRIKEKAKSLGFQQVGIAKSEKLNEEAEHLQEWLERGYQGTMRWMEKSIEKRIDPSFVVPDAKSVVSVAMNYYSDVAHVQAEGFGKISRYAWGDDYHAILEERLKNLLEFIHEEIPGAKGKVYVDTGPVMDKVWAQRAGIGWIGKHTNVISREYGSWIFLGEIILDAELEYDTPATDHCGSCTLCIEACPTKAIVEPYVVDSNKCISYLTIEHEGSIAPDLSGKFEHWLYGCDICQDVCPWNHKDATQTDIEEFNPREGNIAPELADIAAITQEEFSRRFTKSPIKRTKVSGLTRNAKILLQNDAR
ncbi:MAG: tRNA epoxyqueuosine(34) reductase QueG [Bacteroidota bacterium]